MQKVPKVYKRDSASSPQPHIHSPRASGVRVIRSPYGTYVIIRKSSTFLREDAVVCVPGPCMGKRQVGWKDFILCCLSQLSFVSVQPQ